MNHKSCGAGEADPKLSAGDKAVLNSVYLATGCNHKVIQKYFIHKYSPSWNSHVNSLVSLSSFGGRTRSNTSEHCIGRRVAAACKSNQPKPLYIRLRLRRYSSEARDVFQEKALKRTAVAHNA